jgi:hypothetical protein
LSHYVLENGLKAHKGENNDDLYVKFKYTRNRKFFEELEDLNENLLIKPKKIKC